MRTADLDDSIEFLRLRGQCGPKTCECRNQRAVHLFQGCHVNRGWDHIIARLTEIDMIVRVDELTAALAAENLRSPIRNDLIDVHVRRGAGARLKDIYWKVLIQAPVRHLLGCCLNRGSDLRVQKSQLGIHARRRSFQQAQRPEHGSRNAKSADGKIFNSTRCLDTIIRIRGDGQFTHRIALKSRCFSGCALSF